MSFMKEQAVRTTVDIPASLYRQLKAQAAAQGRSVRELILVGVRATLTKGKRPRARRVKFPLIVSAGPKVDLTNEQIYEHLEFP
jgi:plasmid stability protein